MVQPTSNVDPFQHKPNNVETLPPPQSDPHKETNYLPGSTSFATDSAALSFCLYALPEFNAPAACSSPGAMSQIVTLLAKSLQDFQTYISNNPNCLVPNPTTGLAPIQSVVGYTGFFTFLQGGTLASGGSIPRVEFEGLPLFDLNTTGQIYSPAGLMLTATTPGEMLQNQTILSSTWNGEQQGFAYCANRLGEGSGFGEGASYNENLQPASPSPYFNGNNGLIPSPQPSGWPATVPYSPLPNTSSDNVVTILNGEASRFQYYPPLLADSGSIQPNLGYWLNMAVLCIKAMTNKETNQIPDFPTILQYTLNACNLINQSTQYPLDPMTKGFFAMVFSCPDPNLPGGSVWNAIQQGNPTVDVPAIENYYLGLTPSGAPDTYSSFFAPEGNDGLATFLFKDNLRNAWENYAGDTSWIQGALDAK